MINKLNDYLNRRCLAISRNIVKYRIESWDKTHAYRTRLMYDKWVEIEERNLIRYANFIIENNQRNI